MDVMWDDWDDEDEVSPHWRHGRIRRFVADVLAVWRDDDLDIDWYDFARTKGAFGCGLYDFMVPMDLEYDIPVLEPGQTIKAERITASGGWCAPSPPPSWQPWATYYPMRRVNLTIDFCVPALRGPIRYISPPV